MALYNATGGDNWHRKQNWLSDMPLHTWEGVKTDVEGRVVVLFLRDNNLSGEIPPELGGLASLEVLDLHDNDLSGEIPAELGNLANLQALYLSKNLLSGEIPQELGDLSSLRLLHLNENNLRGDVPPELGGMSNLKSLRIDGSWTFGGCMPAALQSQLDMERSDVQDLSFCGAASTPVSVVPTPTPTPPPTPEPTLIDFSWQKDGLTREERYTLQVLEGIQEDHQWILDDVLALPWLADEITSEEWGALSYLSGIAYNDSSLAERVVSLDWFSDGITRAEGYAINDLSVISYYNAELARGALEFPWFMDGVSSGEVEVVSGLRHLSEDEVYASALERALRFPFLLTANVDWRHGRVLDVVEVLVRRDRDLADSILDTAIFDEPGDFFHWSAIQKLPRIVENRVWDHVASQPWFQDGLTDEELILISMAYHISHDEMLFQELIEGASIRSEDYISSLGPPVKLIAVSLSQTQSDEAFEHLYTGVSEMEGLLGVPWQNTLGSWDVPYAGVFVHKKAGNPRLRGEGVMTASGSETTIYHELAHSFFSRADFPRWVSEGVAEFFADYTYYLHAGRPLHTFDHPGIGRGCHIPGISNVSESIEFLEARLQAGQSVGGNQDCAYTVGKSFFLAMYQFLGHGVSSSQLRGLVLEGLHAPEPLTEAETYNVLLSNTPEEKRQEFRDLYRRLHGGPTPDSQ